MSRISFWLCWKFIKVSAAMKRTSLRSNFTYRPPSPSPDSFDDTEPDFDATKKQEKPKLNCDLDNWTMDDLLEDEEESKLEKGCFAFQVENCPPSLKLLVRLFRLNQFSFSGIVFKTIKATDDPPLPRSRRSRFISILTLALNLLVISFYAIPLLIGPFEMQASNENWIFQQINRTIYVMATNATSALYEEFFGSEDYFEEFLHLKPIIRSITKSIVFIFTFEGATQFTLSLLIGGRLIRRMSRIPGSTKYDPNWKLGLQLLLGAYLFTVAICSLGLCIFNRRQLNVFFTITFGAGAKSVSEKDLLLLAKTWILTLIHQYHYFLLSMWTLFFVYTMIIFTRILEDLRKEAREGEVDQVALYDMKLRLGRLGRHFGGIITYFSVPITICMASNAFYIIGSSCFLMIHQVKDADYFTVFVFNVGAFSFARLLILCIAGNAVANAHRELVRDIFENVSEWNLETWMAFQEIKRLAGQFEVSIGGVYSVKQSAILTVLGFALNYIVVLLQTENYGNIGAGVGALKENGTEDLMVNGTIY